MIELLTLMTLDGREVHVNPRHIISIIETRRSDDDPQKLMAPGIRCVVTTIGGGRIATKEECSDVERRLERMRK